MYIRMYADICWAGNQTLDALSDSHTLNAFGSGSQWYRSFEKGSIRKCYLKEIIDLKKVKLNS